MNLPRRSVSPGLVLLSLCILGLLAGVVRVGLSLRREAQSAKCRQQLKQLMAAIHSYEEQYGAFPPAYTVGAGGERLHSWRTLLLPFLGQESLYSRVRFDEPWDSPHNKSISVVPVEAYGCPGASGGSAQTTYFAVVSPITVWPEQFSAKPRDVIDGTSNSVMLVEVHDRQVAWMEPRDLSRDEVVELISSAQSAPHGRATRAAFVDGHVRSIAPTIDRKTLVSILSINCGRPLRGIEWPASSLTTSRESDLPSEPQTVTRTQVSAVTDCELPARDNLIYCCTFRMAWDEARKSAQMAPIMFAVESTLADQLNRQPFPHGVLSHGQFLAMAGRPSAVIPRIREQLNNQGVRPRTDLLERGGDNEYMAYAYLQKLLPFQTSFDRLKEPLSFDGQKVENFGIKDFEGDDAREEQLRQQVTILDYRSDDDFIIRLMPREGRDEIVLAKLPPAKTLAETLATVEERIRQRASENGRPLLERGDKLIVPVLRFNLEHSFDGLVGQKFETPELQGLQLVAALQAIRFLLDENGAILESEALIVADFDGPSHPRRPRNLVFDKPFLIWLRESGGTEPYFAGWMNNTELMLTFSH